MRGRLKLKDLELSYSAWFRIAALMFLFMLGGKSSFAQVKDGFQDGNINDNPIWVGDTSKFKVIDGKLTSNSVVANDKYYIATQCTFSSDFECRFYVNLQFNTSSLNYLDVFISSDSSRLTGFNSGYFVRVGSTDDDICLYQKNGAVVTQLINGRNGMLSKSNNNLVIKVLLSEIGNFSLFADSTGVGQSYEMVGSSQSQSGFTGKFTGFVIKQSTATFFKKHVLDDFYIGPIIGDTSPPQLISWQFDTAHFLKLGFNEKLSPNALSTEHFDVDGQIGNPISVQFSDGDSSILLLELREPLQAFKQYKMSITAISDNHSNNLDTLLSLIWYPVYEPQPGDLVINELLPDPDPAIGLPPCEFVELQNTSNKALLLKGCSFSDNTSKAHFPEFVLMPDSLVVICSKGNELNFNGYGNTISLIGFPSLNNTGEKLILANANGQILHQLNYDLKTYQDAVKEQGGWSLELQDAKQLCIPGNLTASINPNGGTPGKPNSVAKQLVDTTGPQITTCRMVDAQTLRIVFSEVPDSLSAISGANYGKFESELHSIEVINEALLMHFKMNLDTGMEYHIPISGIKDCSGNVMIPDLVNLLIPFKANPGDIIVNEILFNPISGGYDYVELYNRSNKPIGLGDLRLFNAKSSDGISDFSLIDTTGRFLNQFQYLVLTENRDWVCNNYPKHQRGNMLSVSNMPSFPDDMGVVGIMNLDSIVLDEFSYNENMHFELLIDNEGVSLERISQAYDYGVPGIFTSAAAAIGNGTPGLPNSKYMDIQVSDDWFTMSPEIITPNDDGRNDIAAFVVNSSFLNEQFTLMIFDVDGYLVKDVANNIPIGNTQTFYWDGLNNQGEKVDSGLYLIFASRFGFEGKQRVIKKVLAVGVGN